MTAKHNGQRFIFIGGSPRSGTTLIQNMLDCHSKILGGPEFLHLEKFVALRRQLHHSVSIGYIDIICTKKDVDRNIRKLVENFLLPVADKHNYEYYSEKTPKNILIFKELMDIFPQAHFIMVIRDPRAIVASMQQVKRRAIEKGLKQPFFTKNVASSIEYVKKCYEAGFKAKHNPNGKFLTVAYESLLADLENQSKRITEFLGIDWEKQMLFPADKKHLGEKAITKNSGEIWYDAKSYYRNPSKTNIEKWRSNLSRWQQIKTTLAFENVLEFQNVGYDFSLENLKINNKILELIYYYLLRTKRFSYHYIASIARNIPGLSQAKRKILSAKRLF